MKLTNLVLGVFLVVFTSSISLASAEKSNQSTSNKTTNEVFFVASQKELVDALKQKNELRGLAVSVGFYKNSSPGVQKEIDKLVVNVLALKLRPVFLYGQPFDYKLASRLLVVGNDTEDGAVCTPTAWAGIFPKEHGPGKMCGTDDQLRNEQNFRKWLSSSWPDAKILFLKNK